jgi:hypothetical protein
MRTRGAVILNRVSPVLPPQSFKSYSMTMPLSTHWKKVSCEEFECEQYVLGWETVVDISTELGKRQYDYCHNDKTRSFRETREGFTLVRFSYGPGNRPFAGSRHEHRIRVSRPPNFLVRGGDWRGNPRRTPTTVHRNPENWVDDFATHQEKLIRAGR